MHCCYVFLCSSRLRFRFFFSANRTCITSQKNWNLWTMQTHRMFRFILLFFHSTLLQSVFSVMYILIQCFLLFFFLVAYTLTAWLKPLKKTLHFAYISLFILLLFFRCAPQIAPTFLYANVHEFRVHRLWRIQRKKLFLHWSALIVSVNVNLQ